MPTPEQWREISHAFSSALGLSTEERAPYLSSLDPHVRSEVISLLEFEKNPVDYLEQSPRKELAAALSIQVPTYHSGDTIADFKLIEKIGEGSFGNVFRARQISLERDVAVKITPNIGNEAQVMAYLEHDGIVKVFSETVDNRQQIRIICMQYISGPNLENSNLKGIDEQSVLSLAIQLAEALRYAHARGVLHLDIKPSNILLGESGRPYLTDFNVSLNKHREQALSLYGGTKHFMPPEQEACLRGAKGESSKDLDERADIFSLGRVLEFVVSKAGIHEGSLSQNFKWLLNKCTLSDKEERIQNTSELVELLQACRENIIIQSQLRRSDIYSKFTHRFPFFSLAVLLLVPHIIGGVINLLYNSMRIVSNLSASQQSIFETLVVIINPVVYFTSLIAILYFLIPLMRRRDASNCEELRSQTLSVSNKIALISILGWGASALSFPFGIHFLAEPIATEIFGHFFISFFLSAMVATTYGTLNAQYFLLRSLYPILWTGCKDIRKTAQIELTPIVPRVRVYYYLSGVVPLIGAALMVMVGPESLVGSGYMIYRSLLATFIGMGIVGVFYSARSAQDLAETISVMTNLKGNTSMTMS